MSQQYVPVERACATCDFWGGKRQCMQRGDYVEIDSPMDRGECYSCDSGRRDQGGVQACANCTHWKVWCALRKQ